MAERKARACCVFFYTCTVKTVARNEYSNTLARKFQFHAEKRTERILICSRCCIKYSTRPKRTIRLWSPRCGDFHLLSICFKWMGGRKTNGLQLTYWGCISLLSSPLFASLRLSSPLFASLQIFSLPSHHSFIFIPSLALHSFRSLSFSFFQSHISPLLKHQASDKPQWWFIQTITVRQLAWWEGKLSTWRYFSL